MAVSAVVVAYRSRDQLPACLNAIAAIPGIDRVVVVDHGDDGSADVAVSLGADVLRDSTNPGFGAGSNHGVARTSAPYILLVNPDAIVEATAVSEGVAVLEADSRVAAVQGVVRNKTTGQPERSQGVALRPVHLIGRALGARRLLQFGMIRRLASLVPGVADHVERIPAAPVEVESLAATALLIRRAAFDDVAGFDEGFFLYSEDLDLCRRLRNAGWRLLALPNAWAEHTSGASSGGWWERELVWWEGTLRYAALWWSSTQWAMAVAAVAIRTIPMVVARPRRAGDLVERLIRGPMTVRRNRSRGRELGH